MKDNKEKQRNQSEILSRLGKSFRSADSQLVQNLMCIGKFPLHSSGQPRTHFDSMPLRPSAIVISYSSQCPSFCIQPEEYPQYMLISLFSCWHLRNRKSQPAPSRESSCFEQRSQASMDSYCVQNSCDRKSACGHYDHLRLKATENEFQCAIKLISLHYHLFTAICTTLDCGVDDESAHMPIRCHIVFGDQGGKIETPQMRISS